MSTFPFFFRLCLGLRFFSIRDNLLKALQSEKLSAVSSQYMASLTLKTLQNKRTLEDFELFSILLPNKPRNYQLMIHILRGKGRCQCIPFFNIWMGRKLQVKHITLELLRMNIAKFISMH